MAYFELDPSCLYTASSTHSKLGVHRRLKVVTYSRRVERQRTYQNVRYVSECEKWAREIHIKICLPAFRDVAMTT